MLRRGRKSAAQTPAPKKDRVYGSSTNPKGSASSEKSAKSIVLSDKTVLLLRNKLKEFKEKHPNKKNITLNDLKAVYRRGLGAYSSSHRPTITGGVPNSRSAWATARVNKFLLKAGGAKVKAAYVQDDDLMARGGKIDNGSENFGSPNVDWSEVPFIHETDKVSAEKIINQGFVLKPKNNTNGIYTIPYGFKNEKFDKNKVELLVWLKPNSKILWTDTKYPSDFYVGYGNKFYQDIYKELNPEWESTLKNQGDFLGSSKQAEFCRKLESWLKENGYCGVQQGGEYVITDLSCVDYIEYKDDEYADGGGGIEMYDTKKEHAKQYGFDAKKPLYIENIVSVPKEEEIKHIIEYARKNGNDVIFGHIAPEEQEDIELIKSILVKSGFNTIEGNDDFYKLMYADGGEIPKMYHGTSEVEKVIDAIQNNNFRYAKWADGIYMTPNYQIALAYANDTNGFDKGVVEIDFKENPKFKYFKNAREVYDEEMKFTKEGYSVKDSTNMFKDELLSQGYDGYSSNNEVYVLFKESVDKIAFDDLKNIVFEKGGTTFNDAELLRKYKSGKSIGFTGIAHLKAKGLIPRADGTKRKSDKYKEDGGNVTTNSIKLPELDMEYENLKETLDYQGYILEPKLAKGGKLKADGDCYLVAGKIAMGDFKDIDFIGTPYVVHAEVEGQGKISGVRYGHAWVEDDVNVYDFSNGREIIIPKQIYYGIGNIKTNNPKKYRRYTFDQARFKMLETRNYGCWDLDVKYADGGETETESDTVNLKDFESKIWNYKKYIDNQVVEKTKDKGEAMAKVVTKHYDDLERKNIIYVIGGNANGLDLEDISRKFNKSIEYLLKQYFKGLQDEMVHVNDIDGNYNIEDFKRISQIVLDHLEELPNYYEVNKVVEQKIEQQKNADAEGYLKFLNTMIELINEENKERLKKQEEEIDLDKLLAEEEEYMQQVNTYIKENNPNYLADGGELSQEMREKIAQLNISVRTGTDGQVFVGGLKNKNKLYKDEKGYFLIEGYGKFMNKKYPIKKYFSESENETISAFMESNSLYADGGETTIPNNSHQEMVLEDYFEREKTLADALLLLNRSKIYKVMYCNKKIEYAENEGNMTESAYDKNAWNYVANIWKSTLGVVKAENTEYKHGGTTDCGCMHKYGKGGLAYGNSHDNGGIKATVKSTGQSIEYEGGEGVVNKRSMQIEKTYDFMGKKLTPCEIVSQINEMGGGVKFKCEDVKPIIAGDGSYK